MTDDELMEDMGLGAGADGGLDPPGVGKAARDEGMAATRAANKEWADAAEQAIIKNVAPGTKGLFEIFRVKAAAIVGQPQSPNAWGSVARWLKENDYIRDTGEFASPRGKKSHASKKSVVIRTEKM